MKFRIGVVLSSLVDESFKTFFFKNHTITILYMERE